MKGLLRTFSKVQEWLSVMQGNARLGFRGQLLELLLH